MRAAAAFESIAPWLKTYSVYCASFVTAQEKLDRLRGESAEVDKACGAVEDLIHATISSMLIKPVQRLCKYPLLFRELLHEIPDEHPHRALVLSAARTVTAVAAEVNEAVRYPPAPPPAQLAHPTPASPQTNPQPTLCPSTLRPSPSTLHPPLSALRPPPSTLCTPQVREAERRDDLVSLADAVGDSDLITPHRALLLQRDFLLRPNRRASFARRASFGGAASAKGRSQPWP